MASSKQFLNAEEVEADPAIIRHPDARQKRRIRDGQRAGASKLHLNFPFAWRSIEMLESPAYRALSLSARKVLDRLEIEFERHERNPLKNGCLPCTYEDFVAFGISRCMIRPAINEAVALGFIRETRKGSAGNADQREPTLFLLTYRHAGSAGRLENGWRRIKTLEQAEAIATPARERKGNTQAREFGRRGAAARWSKNKNPVMETIPRPGRETIPKAAKKLAEKTDFPVMETIPLSRISSGGAEGSISTRRILAGTQHARFPWSAPLFRELDPVTDEPIGPWTPLLSDAVHAASSRLADEVAALHASSFAVVD
jgi:hypothetical protein